MNDERKPKQEPIGHATIPPGLRPFLARTAQAEEPAHRKDPAMDAAFAKIIDAIEDDVQEIDPDVGVGNTSRYVGPAAVPDGARGKAFTAKVKIAEGRAKSDRPAAPANDGGVGGAGDETTLEQAPPSSRGGIKLGRRTARLMAQAAEHAPPVSVSGSGKSASEGGRSRGRAIAVVIAALGVVVAVGAWVVMQGPREVSETPVPAMSEVVSAARAVPAVETSGGVVAPAPTVAPVATVESDAGAGLSPSLPTRAPSVSSAAPSGKRTPPGAATDDPYAEPKKPATPALLPPEDF